MNTPTQHKQTHTKEHINIASILEKFTSEGCNEARKKLNKKFKKNPEISINALAVKKLKPSKVHSSLNHGYETVCTLLRSGKK